MVLENLVHEHEAIRAHIKFAASLIAGRTPEKMIGTEMSEMPQELANIQTNLKEQLYCFKEGLNYHNQYEEKIMPILFGNLLTEPILIEHKEMTKELTEISLLLSDITPEGIIVHKNYIKVIINSFCSWVVDHSAREDALFKMAIQELRCVNSPIKGQASLSFAHRFSY